MPTDDDLVGLVDAIRSGIVGTEPYPFATSWAIDAEPQRTWNTLAFHWGCRTGISGDSFKLPLVAVHDGAVIGSQSIGADDFKALRTVNTGSWIATPWQGRGFAREMRSAVLTFAFEHLGATVATSNARRTTDRSIKVSTGLGYRESGRAPFRFGDEIGEAVRLRLDVADWRRLDERPLVRVDGWHHCAPMFDAGPGESS